MDATRAHQSGRHASGWRRKAGIGLAGAVALVWVGGMMFSSERPVSAKTLQDGRELFVHEWAATPLGIADRDPLVAPAGDGLGPVFNAKSCVACHSQGGVGGAGQTKQNVLAFDVVPTRTNPKFHEGVVHASAVTDQCHECSTEVNRIFPIVQGEQRRVGGCVITIPDFDPVRFTPINPPSLFGSGAIDHLADSAIRGYQRKRQVEIYPRELRGDFTATPAGRARVLADGRIGKFGWKAQFATLEEFVANACAVELGLSNPKRRQDRPHQQGEDRDAPLDMTAEQLLALTAFTESLPVPVRRLPATASELLAAEKGEQLFTSIGCAECHVSSLGSVAGIYSDLLLHKLEDDTQGGAYGRVDPDLNLPADQPFPNEWKTPPLWGVADTAPYFHDGGCPTLESAILRHGAQARHVTARYRNLEPEDQQAILRFLETMRAPEVEAAPYSRPAVELVDRR